MFSGLLFRLKNRKREKINLKRPAQNLVEFVFIIPLLIAILFGILEFAIFYRNVNAVEDIATEAAVAASRRLVLDTMTSNNIADTSNTGFNKAAKAARDVVMKRRGTLGIPALTLAYNDLGAGFGARPYALYEIVSTQTRLIDGVSTPIITLVVDYRTPSEDGIMVQLIYQYRTLLVGAQLPMLGSTPVTLIPRDIPISSTRIKQYLIY
ncbi:MAG: hypothetical protein A2039_06025 [Candidatus Melainabacteria bacterium GWA2_34_9]|nr:MAG: hypothetical protein A2039_06025 [Candidatus Melainabacteria bacterium GWA2_34_9]